MKAVYLDLKTHKPLHITPGSDTEPFSAPPTPSSLIYTTSFPSLSLLASLQGSQLSGHHHSSHSYHLRVLTTSPTRGELSWAETKDMAKRHGPGPVPCHDVVGIITAIHHNPQDSDKPKFEVGDKVMGLVDFDRDGAAAEEVLVLKDEISKIPQHTQISNEAHDEQQWEEMLATIPLAGLTAWQALFQKGELREPGVEGSAAGNDVRSGVGGGQKVTEVKRVLITGASGAVGLLAVQLAIAARSVTQSVYTVAVASERHVESVKQLGAGVVVPSMVDDVRQVIERRGPFDLILEMTGGSLRDTILSMHKPVSYTEEESSKSSELLTSTGKIVSITAPLAKSAQPRLGLSDKDFADLENRFDFFIVKPDSVQLEKIARLMEMGRLKGLVHGEVFSLERGKEALEECEKRGRAEIGKVVIRVTR